MIGKWLQLPSTNDQGKLENIFYSSQSVWLEKDSQLGVYPFKSNVINIISPCFGSSNCVFRM